MIGFFFAVFFVLPAQSQQPAATSQKSASITFTEITSKVKLSSPLVSGVASLPASIRSQDYSINYARRTLVPAIGGSVAVGDFDGDGLADLYAVIPGGSNHLFHQLADGTFVDVTERAKVPGTGADISAAFGDFDKSGRLSLFVAGLAGVTVYRNDGNGSFTDVTAKTGLKLKAGELATSVLLFDADGDGFPDVLITIYTDFSKPPAKSSFTFPNDFAGAASHLYRNQHDGTFIDVTEASGLADNPGRTHTALAADFDHNGRMDLLFLRDNKPPALFRNQGQGKFEEYTWDAGQDIWKYGYLEGQIGDFNHDGKPDVALWSTVGNEVLINQGEGKFDDDESLPLVYAANRAFGFHGLAADFNGDGYEDLLTVDNKDKWHLIVNRNGHFEDQAVAFSTEKDAGLTPNASPLPIFSSMTTARLRKDGNVDLIGVTADGRLEIFESNSAKASTLVSFPAKQK